MNIQTAAKNLARANAESEPNILKIFWFPDEKQIRLLEIDQETMSSDDNEIRPFYFSPVADIPFVTAIALICPEEEHRLNPPADWGTWDSALLIFERQRNAA